MSKNLGFTRSGLDLALQLKRNYSDGKPRIMLGASDTLLMPEHFLNHNIDLQFYEDPLPLAMVAARDPDSPMAVSAAVRMCGIDSKSSFTHEVFGLLKETSKHKVVRTCVDLVLDNSFNPKTVGRFRCSAERFVALSRKNYTELLKRNLRRLLEGEFDARLFVSEFFKLSEAGNLRIDIRKKLILGLLLSERIRPSIKFLFLENLDRLPTTFKKDIINVINNSPSKGNLDIIKKELMWMQGRHSGTYLN